MGGSNDGLQDVTNSLVDRIMAYGMEVSRERRKFMTNNTNSISADISLNGQKSQEVTSFKYLRATLCKDGTCSAEIHNRIASVIVKLAELN